MNISPCPFCGKSAEYVCEDDHHGDYFRLGCTDEDCPAHWTYYTEPQENAEKCIARWNFRTGAPAQSVGVQEAAQAMVDLFVWEPDDESGEVTPHLDRQTPHLYDVLTKLRDALAAQPPAAPVETPRRMYDSQNGEHYVVDAKGDAYEPDRSSAAAPAETDIQAALGDDYKLYSRRKLEEENARPRAQLRSSAATEREDNTCYVNRSEVRCILLAQSTRDVPATEKMLRAIDALPIFVAADFRDEPQAAPLTDILASCKGEHSKFEEWAAAEKYDMQEHPIHYLFTDPKTYAARQGWKAALRYVSSQLTRPQSRTGEA